MRYFSLLLLSLCFPVLATDAHVNVRVQAQQLTASQSPLFPAEDSELLVNAIDLSLEHEGWRLAATAWGEKHEQQERQELELSEFFYDFSLADWQLSLGKKKIDWDVGFGFRPLDMFSPTSPLALYTAVAPGTWLIAGDYFSDKATLTLLCNESQPDYQIAGEDLAAGTGCGSRYYRYMGDWELQGVIHYDSQLKSRLGLSAQTVFSDALEFHASWLWQESYSAPQFHPENTELSSFQNPVTSDELNGASMGLLGVNYSTHFGLNLILEYWYDGRSPSDDEWQVFLNRVDQQADQLQVNPLIAHQLSAQRQMFSASNLFRHNLMLHLRSGSEQWRPRLTLLVNPEDKGLLLDGAISYHWPAGHSLSLGYRHYGGSTQSVYRQLENETTLYSGFELVF